MESDEVLFLVMIAGVLLCYGLVFWSEIKRK